MSQAKTYRMTMILATMKDPEMMGFRMKESPLYSTKERR